MEATNFSVFCIKRYEGKYGLIVIFQPNTKVSPSLPELKEIKFSEVEVSKEFIGKMKKLLGYWHGCCDSNKLKISNIHLIFPTDFEIYSFDKELKIFLLTEYGIDLKVDIGMQINEAESSENIQPNYLYIQQLIQKDSKLN